jgi:hypothetical protein
MSVPASKGLEIFLKPDLRMLLKEALKRLFKEFGPLGP